LLTCLIALLLSFAGGSASCQQAPPAASVQTKTDVVLFVHPTGPASARIGLAYSTVVGHAQVRAEIKKLIAVTGWKLSEEPTISDASVRPDNPRRFPPTTGAMFSVTNAPQFRDNAPLLAPYLQAFQVWNRLEILFVTTDLQPYNGVTNFRSSALDVTLEKSEGVYRYLVTLREHTKDLPPLVPDVPPSTASQNTGTSAHPEAVASRPASAGVGTPASGSSLFWPSLFIITGSVLVVGVALFLLAKRHTDHLKPGRSR
jgi:hypothetical protein